MLFYIFFHLEDKTIGLILNINLFSFLLICFSISFSIFNHFVNLFI